VFADVPELPDGAFVGVLPPFPLLPLHAAVTSDNADKLTIIHIALLFFLILILPFYLVLL
jgi:hypothetical protein